MPQLLLGLLLLVIVIFIIGFVFQNIVGFLGIGIAIWGIYEWNVNRKLKAKSKKPGLIVAFGLVLAIGWFATPHAEPVDNTASDKEKQQEEAETPNTETETETQEEKSVPEESEKEDSDSPTTEDTNQKEETSSDLNETSNSAKTNTESDEASETANFATATVVRITDGDTINLQFEDGTTDKIRLLLVDTPETKHPDLPVQPFGPEASAFAKEQLLGKEVKVEYDGPMRDKYDRLLGYLWVGDKIFNQMLLEEGLARYAYVYDPPYTHASEFMKAQNRAKQAKKGIWSINGYVTADGFQTTESETQSTSEAEQHTASGNSSGGYSGPYDPNGPDRDCGDFKNHEEAQAFYEAAGGPEEDPHRLDGSDNDGLVCESM